MHITVPDPNGTHLIPVYDGDAATAWMHLEPGLHRCITETGDEKALWITAAKSGLADVAVVTAAAEGVQV